MDDQAVDAAAWQNHRDKADLYSSLGHQIAGLQSDETDLIAFLKTLNDGYKAEE